MSHVLLVQGNARQIPLKDQSAHMVITSPPYFGLRSYGIGSAAGEVGSEALHDCGGACTGQAAIVFDPFVGTVKPCPKCGGQDILMTGTDGTTPDTMVYRLRCYGCRYAPQWAASQTEAQRIWHAKRRRSYADFPLFA